MGFFKWLCEYWNKDEIRLHDLYRPFMFTIIGLSAMWILGVVILAHTGLPFGLGERDVENIGIETIFLPMIAGMFTTGIMLVFIFAISEMGKFKIYKCKR